MCAAQEQALRVNSKKHHINSQDVSPMCGLCAESSETVMHLNSGCPVFAKLKCQIRHDIVGKRTHLLLLKIHGIPTGNKWYSHVPNVVTETDNGKVTIYWGKAIKTERKVSYNRQDMVVIDRVQNAWYILDFAIPIDRHVKEKEEEKIDKFMDLAAEVRRKFRMKTVIVPIVFRALGRVPAKLLESLKKLETEDAIGSLQTAVLISTKVRVRT